MKHKNVIIRSRDNVDLLGPRIKKALNTVDKKYQVPVYYQYCQEKDPILETDPSKFIGKAFNIHETPDGDIVCDVITNDALALAVHFQGMIDNFLISVEPDEYGNQIPTLKQLVIYDKDFKAAVDQRRQEIAAGRTSAPMEGTAAEPRVGENPITPEVVDSLKEEFEQEVATTVEDNSDMFAGLEEEE